MGNGTSVDPLHDPDQLAYQARWIGRSATLMNVEETWIALDRLIALFRQVAFQVSKALGYTYPQDVDDQVSAYLEAIHEMPSPRQ